MIGEREMSSTDVTEIFCDGAWSKVSTDGGCSAVAKTGDCICFCNAKYLEVCKSIFEAEVNGI